MENPLAADPWDYTLGLLTQLQLSTSSGAADGLTRPHRKSVKSVACAAGRELASRAQGAHLHIVELYSDSAITVCWRDVTSGYYGEQLWKRVTSRKRATCALSGLRIDRGDAVFRPWVRGHRPVNVGLMILASAVAGPTE